MNEDTLDDQEIFDAATEPEAKTEAPQEAEAKTEEAANPVEDESGRLRDPVTKRFVAKDKSGDDESPAEVQADEPEQVKESKDHRIPLTELLNEREKRQAAERERQNFQQQLWQLQQQLQAKERQEEPADIFADPQAYQSQVQQSMDQRLKAMEGNFSLRLAAYKHGDAFHEAWAEMMNRTQSGDDSMRQQVLQSPDPGETLVQVYQREQTLKEVGTDPSAYKAKVMEDALNDPEFLAKALEKARAQAGTQPKNNKIDLPPSLNKVASAASATDDSDMSDRGVYSYATR